MEQPAPFELTECEKRKFASQCGGFSGSTLSYATGVDAKNRKNMQVMPSLLVGSQLKTQHVRQLASSRMTLTGSGMAVTAPDTLAHDYNNKFVLLYDESNHIPEAMTWAQLMCKKHN